MARNASTTRSFHLVDHQRGADTAGRPASRGSAAGAPADDAVLVVPDGVSRLVFGDGRRPRILSRPRRRGPVGDRIECVLEPLRRGHDTSLLLLAPPGRPVRINGEHTAHVICLRQRDVIQIGRWTLHIAVHVHAEIGLAPAEYAGHKCAVCRRDVAGTVVYLCVCGAAIHCDRSGRKTAADCLLGTDCPVCRTPIRFDGYGDLPEGL